jgi:hypothetical protein
MYKKILQVYLQQDLYIIKSKLKSAMEIILLPLLLMQHCS